MKEIKKRYFNYLNKNITNINESSTICIFGATGGLGESLCNYLGYLKCNLILCARNLNELNRIKEEIKVKYNNDKVKLIHLDYLNLDSIYNLINELKLINKIDIFINNIGVYHLPIEMINNKEKTFIVNTYRPILLINELVKLNLLNKTNKLIVTTSISYTFNKINFDDFEMLKEKNKTTRYSLSKRSLMEYLIYLKKTKGLNIIMAHPGIANTNLFSKKNKAYGAWFYALCVPLMKILFMSSDKACLSLVKSCDIKNVKLNEWVGPRGLFHSWGYPNIQRIHKDMFNEEIIEKAVEIIDKKNKEDER